MFVNTQGGALKRFAKFGSQKQIFVGRKRKKRQAHSSQTDYKCN